MESAVEELEVLGVELLELEVLKKLEAQEELIQLHFYPHKSIAFY
jgi:hypothetical protein